MTDIVPRGRIILKEVFILTVKQEWRIAKWIRNHQPVKRQALPSKLIASDMDFSSLYSVVYRYTTPVGNPVASPDDEFFMTDANIDAFRAAKKKRTHEFRDWLEPTGVVVANIIAVIALIVSVIALASPG